ncbi:glycoside hydrolase family 20 protein [Flavobacterium tructae]|uniref:beta-N-acetylhexosaminidase n=1 Tax=Flavobacterium tructae TaxID=1114873 RepID=A0A1S1J455_9FLAO|nr:family 20 glycosylhydrolase [Flavobacterium tructae]OHT43966.1 beta-N-acetylhexosaminidase [Flavobacterium tructae]OXB21520.1 beta-N-acetylhexosaminidase [Flavobacterium tructae]
MRILKSVVIVFFLTLLSNAYSQKANREKGIQIIPKPKQLVLKQGNFQFSATTKFVVSDDDAQKEIVTVLINKFGSAAGFRPEISNKIPKSNYVQFKVDTALKNEAYLLEVNKENITITAKGSAGFIYGLESIRQLLPESIESKSRIKAVKWEIPTLTITDEPRFQWRGLMLDLSRHFFDKSYIIETIDRLAMLKMNVLHLHLVDDQGWRIEIKKYPKLTEVGAWRVDQENAPWNARQLTNPDEKGTYGGFLTQEELKEIVKYAAAKNIEIIPEIEMPAHVSSAIAAYPELACFNQRIGVPSGGLWPITDIYCAGKETTFEFLQNVIEEVIEIFPSKYIHIGGDEATKTNWDKCPNCQKRMKDNGLKDAHELQSYFVKRMEQYINSKGKKIIGWDEILEGGLAPEATVMSWRGTVGGTEAARQGHDVIMSPESPCYFNFYQGPQNVEPLAFDAFNPLNKVYAFDPVVDTMTPQEANHVLGGQANLWAEYITNTKASEYMIFPRLAALSEVLWSTRENRDWNNFTSRLPSLLQRYDYLGINYAKSAYLVTSTASADLNNKVINVALKNEFPNSDIRYVLGDKNIDDKAIKYTNPIAVKETTILKASLFQDNKPVGRIFTDTIVFHKAVGHKVNYVTPYNDSYKGDGALGMVNTIRGSKNFHDGQWQAWLVKDMEIVIDLEIEQSIEKVTVGTLESQGAGIYFPIQVTVLVSKDGTNYKEARKILRPFAVNVNSELKDFKINFEKQEVRFVKVIATNLKKSPTGSSSWLFVDEIVVD